jgi:hypothetical protein
VRQRFRFPLIAIAFSIVLSACGIGAAAAKPTPTGDPQRAMLAFAQCMRAHGIDMPDPGANGNAVVNLNVDPTTFQAAQNACRSKLKNAGLKTPSAAQMAQARDQAVKFAQCMRAHGINMPDPQFTNGGILQRAGGDIDPSSAEFQTASKACAKDLPSGGKITNSSGGGAGVAIGGQ